MTAITIPNTFLPSTTISSTAMNQNFSTVATAIQASLANDGTDTMTGQLRGAAGPSAAPGYAFGVDLDVGMFRKAANELGFATAGVLGAHIDASQKFWHAGAVDIAGALTVAGAVTLPNDSVSYAEIQNVSATSRLLGRVTAGAGDIEELTLSQALDLIGSAAQGDILFRGASAWSRLAAGASGQILTTGGAGQNPAWGNGKVVQRAYTQATSFSTTNTIAPDGSIPQISEGGQVLSQAITPTSATNRLRILVWVNLAPANVGSAVIALFNGAADAVAVCEDTVQDNGWASSMHINYEVVAGGTGAITFSVRAGSEAAGTTALSSSYGTTIPRASMIIEEIVP